MDKNTESGHTSTLKVRIAAGGRIVIPAEVRQELGVKEGDEVLITRDPKGFRITTYRDAIRRAKELFAQIKEPGASLADELIQERQREVTKEEREFGKSAGRN